jgi:hypothetical protein
MNDWKFKIGAKGIYQTQGTGTIARRIEIIGICPAGVSITLAILNAARVPALKRGVFDVSNVDRYIVQTPKLTAKGDVSKTGKFEMMSPVRYTFDSRFEEKS